MKAHKHVSHVDATDSASLVKFNFHGDELDVVPGDGEAHVVVRRVCEALGVAFQPQLEKLRNDQSVVITMIVTTGPDGKRYETSCLDVRSLPLWLATIHPSKVRASVREKLVTYKRECAAVLADHFLGRRVPANDVAIGLLRRFEEALVESSREIRTLREQVTALAASSGTITGVQADTLRDEIDVLAKLRAALGKNPSTRSARCWIQNQLARAIEWGGSGAVRRFMPADRYGKARAFLAGIRREVEADEKRLRRASERRSVELVKSALRNQGKLPFDGEPH